MSRERQCAAILRVLTAANGGWIELPRIQDARGPKTNISQYGARIKELRDGDFDKVKHNIENKTARIGEDVHSWYRLLPEGQITMKGV